MEEQLGFRKAFEPETKTETLKLMHNSFNLLGKLEHWIYKTKNAEILNIQLLMHVTILKANPRF